MNDKSTLKAICPLFNLQIDGVLYGEHTREEAAEYFKALGQLREQGFEVFDKVKIRQLSHSDIDHIQKSGLINLLGEVRDLITTQTFLIEIPDISKDENPRETERKIYKLLLALRLYKAEGVPFCKVIWYEEKSMATSLTIINPPIPWKRDIYLLKTEEIEDFRRMANLVNNIDFESRKSLTIACERFSRSYEERRVDERIIDFMIGFESLFLKGKASTANIGRFIGLGCSMLLGRNDTERAKINDFLVEAYAIRNKIVHGSESVTSVKEDFILQLQSYLRESIKKLVETG
jgi:hypothetical protein